MEKRVWNSPSDRAMKGLIDILRNFERDLPHLDDVLMDLSPDMWRAVKEDVLDFLNAYEDKLSEERKLRIAIIGQIKAGKSTFLNCLLFNCSDVLPKAATPTTASLNFITYSQTPKVVVEFFTLDDLEAMERDSEDTLEILEAADKNASLLQKGSIELAFDSQEQFREILREYVSAGGRYSLLVKSLYLYLNNEDLKNIEIVDTPGLNDPVVSRSRRTAKFMERADIVIYMSPASSFMDINDLKHITSIYGRSSSKIYPLASRFDSVLVDALTGLRQKLFKRFKKPDFREIYEVEKEKRIRELFNQIEKFKLDGSMFHKELLIFSSAFRKLELGLPLSPDEEKPIRLLRKYTTNFDPAGYSGFDQVRNLISKYSDQKMAEAEKKDIIRIYMMERPLRIYHNFKELYGRIKEEEGKKREDLERERAELSRRIEEFSREKARIHEEITNIYTDYFEYFRSNVISRFYQLKDDTLSKISAIKEMAERERVEREVYVERRRKGGIWDDVREIPILGWLISDFLGFGWEEERYVKYIKYQYYDRDVLLDRVRDELNRVYSLMRKTIEESFPASEVKEKIISKLRQYQLPSHIVSLAVNMNFSIPTLHPPMDMEERLYNRMSRYAPQIERSKIGYAIRSLKSFIRKMFEEMEAIIENIEGNVREQLENQVEGIIRSIDEYFDGELSSLQKRLDMTEQAYKEFKESLARAKNYMEMYVKEVEKYAEGVHR